MSLYIEVFEEVPRPRKRVEVVQHNGTNEQAIAIAEWLAQHNVLAYVIPRGAYDYQSSIVSVVRDSDEPLLILGSEIVLRDVDTGEVTKMPYKNALRANFDRVNEEKAEDQ